MSNRHVPNLLDPFKYSSQDQRAEYAAGLRELAAWVETTDFPLHHHAMGGNVYAEAEITIRSNAFEDEDQDFVKRVGSAAKLIGGRVEKSEYYTGGPFRLTRTFRGGVRFIFELSRTAVCEKKTVVKDVTKAIPVDVTTATELERQKEEIEKKISELKTVVKTVPTAVEEYVCPPSLLAVG